MFNSNVQEKKGFELRTILAYRKSSRSFFLSFAKALAQVGTYQQMMAKPEGFRHIGLLRHKPGGDLKITCG